MNMARYSRVLGLQACLLLQVSAIAANGWEEGSGYRSISLKVAASGRVGFKLLASSETGILWTNSISEENVAKHYNMVSGAGVAAGDYDGDGLCDLYFCNRGGKNGLFRNLG